MFMRLKRGYLVIEVIYFRRRMWTCFLTNVFRGIQTFLEVIVFLNAVQISLLKQRNNFPLHCPLPKNPILKYIWIKKYVSRQNLRESIYSCPCFLYLISKIHFLIRKTFSCMSLNFFNIMLKIRLRFS